VIVIQDGRDAIAIRILMNVRETLHVYTMEYVRIMTVPTVATAIILDMKGIIVKLTTTTVWINHVYMVRAMTALSHTPAHAKTDGQALDVVRALTTVLVLSVSLVHVRIYI
jgi:hypothetical protein